MKVLFVCYMGLHRSPTFADVATSYGFDCRSCGVHHDALIQISDKLIDWADTVVFLNKAYYQEANRKMWLSKEYNLHKFVILNTDDVYERNSKELKLLADNFVQSYLLKGN